MKRIIPHLWFDREAKEAAAFYTELFSDARITLTRLIADTPSGDVDAVDFKLEGQPFRAISAGPEFRLNPSISLFVTCSTVGEVDALWHSLIEGGTALMELGEYPFSRRFGWLQDRFGVSWQFNVSEGEKPKQKIVPYMQFSGPARGKAADAVKYYTELFRASDLQRKRGDEAPDETAAVSEAGLHIFHLLGQRFFAMDHGYDADFTFNEAFSWIVICDTQEEINYFWNKLSKVPEAEACGWLKDQFGVSWQIVPNQLGEWMETGTAEQTKRLTEAMLQMKKLDIAVLQKAYLGE